MGLLKLIIKLVVLVAFVFGWMVLFQHGTEDFSKNAEKEFRIVQAALPFLTKQASVNDSTNEVAPPEEEAQQFNE